MSVWKQAGHRKWTSGHGASFGGLYAGGGRWRGLIGSLHECGETERYGEGR